MTNTNNNLKAGMGNPQKPDSAYSRQYNNLFPTTYISYNAGKNNQFTFSYGKGPAVRLTRI